MRNTGFLPSDSMVTKAVAALAFSVSTVGLASAGMIVIPGATISVHASACTTTPCTTDNSQSATTGTVSFDPLGTTTYTLSQDLNNVLSNGSVTVNNNPLVISVGGAGNASSVTASGLPAPSITTMVVSPGDPGGGDASGTLDYYFAVVSSVGAIGTADINVNAVGSVSGTATGSSPSVNVSEQLYIPILSTTDSVLNDTASVVFTGDGSQTSGFTEAGNIDYVVNIGEAYEVTLETNVECPGNAVSCTASIDPVISLAAGSTSDLSLEFSSDIGNGTPEPGTWTLFAVGVMFLIAAQRRRLGRTARS
jgi:hypothetical protein